MRHARCVMLGLLAVTSAGANIAIAQTATTARQYPKPASNVGPLRSALNSRIGRLWVGEGQLPELGTYRSERQFIRIGPNEIAVLHKMTVGKTLLSYDSLSFVFKGNSVELSGEDMRGQALRAALAKGSDPLNFTFQRGEDWRSVYSGFRPDGFVLEVFTKKDGVWVSYLRTVHKPAK